MAYFEPGTKSESVLLAATEIVQTNRPITSSPMAWERLMTPGLKTDPKMIRQWFQWRWDCGGKKRRTRRMAAKKMTGRFRFTKWAEAKKKQHRVCVDPVSTSRSTSYNDAHQVEVMSSDVLPRVLLDIVCQYYLGMISYV